MVLNDEPLWLVKRQGHLASTQEKFNTSKWLIIVDKWAKGESFYCISYLHLLPIYINSLDEK